MDIGKNFGHRQGHNGDWTQCDVFGGPQELLGVRVQTAHVSRELTG